jgi:signal transduction histidine kinase/CheY-like chemotaxis protein
VTAVVTAGVLCALVLFTILRNWERRTAQAAVQAVAAQRVELLHEALSNSLEALHALGSFFSTEPVPDRIQFRRFVQDILARRPELHALSWTPQVPASERTVYEARARTEGLADFQFTEIDPASGLIIPAHEKAVYYPVYYIEPARLNATALGYDLNQRITTLALARDLGTAVSTPSIQLVQEPDNLPGFIVYLPLYTEGPSPVSTDERRSRLTGFVAAVFRVSKLVDPALAHLPGLDVTLRDATSGTAIAYAPPQADAAPAASRLDPVTRTLAYAGREWRVTFTPTTAFAPGRRHWQSWTVLGGGLALTLLLSAYLHASLRSRRQIAHTNAVLQMEVQERKRAEDAAAAANSAKSDFLAGLSHEIRTPLNSILGYAQILERDPDLLLRQRDSVAALTASGRHLLGLLNSILDLSKIEAGRTDMRREIFDLRALVRELADMFKPRCAEKKLTLRVLLPANVPAAVTGDEGKLRQVLINLLGNAVKFTPRGEIIVSLSSTAPDRWRFDVVDTGIGLVSSERGGLFTPFHQTAAGRHHGGTGLGLALARRHVELMGGDIEAQSEPGTGTRFHFTLTLPASLLPCATAHDRLPRLAENVKVRALVVDDNRDNRVILARLLIDIGCRVAAAGSPADARATAFDQPPDILFVDVRLEGTTGPALVAQLHDAGLPPATPVIYHTAALLDSAGREALRVKGADLLAKPFRIEDLCACLQRVSGVRFDDAPEPSEPPPLELEGLILPAELSHRLAVAAELHSTTVLKACLDELRQLGGPAVPLADHLRHLLRSYDLVAIARVLDRLRVHPPAEPTMVST